MINTLGQTFGGAMEAKMDNLSTIASKEYLLPEILETVGYTKGDIVFSNEVIRYNRQIMAYQAGVRNEKKDYLS